MEYVTKEIFVSRNNALNKQEWQHSTRNGSYIMTMLYTGDDEIIIIQDSPENQGFSVTNCIEYLIKTLSNTPKVADRCWVFEKTEYSIDFIRDSNPMPWKHVCRVDSVAEEGKLFDDILKYVVTERLRGNTGTKFS